MLHVLCQYALCSKTHHAKEALLQVISMLEGLQDKFVDERVTLEKEEAKKRHTYVARRFLGVETRREMKTQIGPIKWVTVTNNG